MSAWILLPVLLLLQYVGGHTLPVPQTHGGDYQDRPGLQHVDKTRIIPVMGGGVRVKFTNIIQLELRC